MEFVPPYVFVGDELAEMTPSRAARQISAWPGCLIESVRDELVTWLAPLICVAALTARDAGGRRAIAAVMIDRHTGGEMVLAAQDMAGATLTGRNRGTAVGAHLVGHRKEAARGCRSSAASGSR